MNEMRACRQVKRESEEMNELIKQAEELRN